MMSYAIKPLMAATALGLGLVVVGACNDEHTAASTASASTAASAATAATASAAASAAPSAAASSSAAVGESPEDQYKDALAACQKLLDCREAVSKGKVKIPETSHQQLDYNQNYVKFIKQAGPGTGQIASFGSSCKKSLRRVVKETEGHLPDVCKGY